MVYLSQATRHYDSRGNVTDDGLRAYTYNLANQPTQITGLANAQFVYDGNFKRVAKITEGVSTYLYSDHLGSPIKAANIRDRHHLLTCLSQITRCMGLIAMLM